MHRLEKEEEKAGVYRGNRERETNLIVIRRQLKIIMTLQKRRQMLNIEITLKTIQYNIKIKVLRWNEW